MNFETYLSIYHKLKPEDVIPSSSKGYWIIIKPCEGYGKCKHPLHNCMGNKDKMNHTISFTDNTRDKKGKFTSPYKTWKKHREQYLLKK